VKSKEAVPSSPSRETEERVPRKQNLEHRQPSEPFQFKRLLRPVTAIAARVAEDKARAESHAPLETVDHTAMQFGKIHPHATPDYRPNRLFRVLDSIYTHSPLKWLDFIERGGIRFIFATIFISILGGFIVWRYYDSLSTREGNGPKAVEMATGERIDRGKKTVRDFMAAPTAEARLPLVIDPERAAPRMKQFYEEMKGEDPKVTAWEVGGPVAGKHGVWLPFIFQNAAGQKVTVVMEETNNGCRIDWENFVAFGDMPWRAFCDTRPVAAKAMRVRLRRADNYEGAYTREKYQAYEIEHRSGVPRLLGYAERSERSGQALVEVVKGDQWQAAQIYLRFADSPGAKDTVLMGDIVRSRWQDEAASWTGP
jgi:hypothetical protein